MLFLLICAFVCPCFALDLYIYIYIGELVGRTREFGGKLFEDERVDARKGGGREGDTKGETKRGRGKNLGEG